MNDDVLSMIKFLADALLSRSMLACCLELLSSESTSNIEICALNLWGFAQSFWLLFDFLWAPRNKKSFRFAVATLMT